MLFRSHYMSDACGIYVGGMYMGWICVCIDLMVIIIRVVLLWSCLYYMGGTLRKLFLELDPILQHHLKLLKDEVVGEPVSPWPPLVEIVLMGCELLHRSVGVDAVPGFNTIPYQ